MINRQQAGKQLVGGGAYMDSATLNHSIAGPRCSDKLPSVMASLKWFVGFTPGTATTGACLRGAMIITRTEMYTLIRPPPPELVSVER